MNRYQVSVRTAAPGNDTCSRAGQPGLASQVGSPIRFTKSTLEVVSDSNQDERFPSPSR